MMKWQDALAHVESIEFDAEVNMVSSARAFFHAVAAEPVMRDLYRQARESAEVREEILGRIYDLSAREIDLKYENPNDTPLAALLWLTCYAAPDFLPTAARITAQAPQCWYARKLARSIIAAPPPVESKNTRFWFEANGSRRANNPTAVSTFYAAPADSKLRFVPGSGGKADAPATGTEGAPA